MTSGLGRSDRCVLSRSPRPAARIAPSIGSTANLDQLAEVADYQIGAHLAALSVLRRGRPQPYGAQAKLLSRDAILRHRIAHHCGFLGPRVQASQGGAVNCRIRFEAADP